VIISDEYKFCFIHIPKCAGSTVRDQLKQYDDRVFLCHDNYGELPGIGRFHSWHIPLFILREHFPEHYQKIAEYESYALLRNPHARFSSSVFQYFKEFRSSPLYALPKNKAKKEVYEIIRVLREKEEENISFLPYEYVHFQRQVDYIYDQGERVIDNIYTINDVEELLADIHRKIGGHMLPDGEEAVRKINQSIAYRNSAIRIFLEVIKPFAGPAWRSLVPVNARIRIKESLVIPENKRTDWIFDDGMVIDFVERYYREDIKMVKNIERSKRRKES